MNDRSSIYAVIVCYQPDVRKLEGLCSLLVQNSISVVVIDNTKESYISELIERLGCKLIQMHGNSGIARAQNVGIKYALEEGAADVIMFFDQDSILDRSCLSHLLDNIVDDAPRVVAPVYVDNEKGYEYPSIRLNRCGLSSKIHSVGEKEPYEVDIVISSGSVATAAVFGIAGFMDEDLFIDHVDTEWCLRCRDKGVPVLVVPGAIMRHSIGNCSMDLGIMKLCVHDPQRSYYKMRNVFLLLRKPHVPFLFCIDEIAKSLIHATATILLVRGRSKHMRSFFAGIFDGIRGCSGVRAGVPEEARV